MLEELTPGAQLGREANPYGFDLRRAVPPLQYPQGYRPYSNPDYGSKMPSEGQAKTDIEIGEAQAKKQAEADAAIPSPFLKFLGIHGGWNEIGVYGLLLILFLIGIVSLLSASGIVGSPVKTIIKKAGGK